MKKSLFLVFAIVTLTCTSCVSTLDFNEDAVGKYYINQDGSLKINDWIDINGKWYYFNDKGYLVCNDWVDKIYYMDKHGVMLRDKWYTIGDIKYYFKSDGTYARDEVLTIKKKEYTFDKKGQSLEAEVK